MKFLSHLTQAGWIVGKAAPETAADPDLVAAKPKGLFTGIAVDATKGVALDRREVDYVVGLANAAAAWLDATYPPGKTPVADALTPPVPPECAAMPAESSIEDWRQLAIRLERDRAWRDANICALRAENMKLAKQVAGVRGALNG